MINVQNQILLVMKHTKFSNSELENKAARLVLAELKTKQKDILTDITAEIQFKILKKMLNDRISASQTYHNVNREDLAEKEDLEKNIIQKLIDEISNELPKLMTEEEIRIVINNTIKNIEKPNIGIIMKAFKDLNADKKLVSEIAKEIINKLN